MSTIEATEKFRRSQQLFDEKRYAEALAVLDELVAQFPDTKNVLYPRALCLYKLRRYDEAKPVCSVLTERYSDPRATDLLERINARQGDVPAASLVDIVLPAEPSPAANPRVHAQQPSSPSNKRKFMFCVFAVAFVLAAVAVLVQSWLGQSNERQAAGDGSENAGDSTELTRINWIAHEAYARGDYDQALRRPTLFFFSSTGSEACEKMEERVLEDPSIRALTEGWLFVKVEADNTNVAKVSRGTPVKKAVKSVPTVVLLASSDKEVYRQEGVPMVRDLYAVLLDLDLQVEGPREAAHSVQPNDSNELSHITFTPAALVFCVFAATLFVFKKDIWGRFLYMIVFIGLLYQLSAATRFTGIIPGPKTPETYLCTIPHLVALVFAMLALTLEANLKERWTIALYSASVFGVWATAQFASIHWERLDIAGADWRAAIWPILIINTIVGVPLAGLAHAIGQPSEGSIYSVK